MDAFIHILLEMTTSLILTFLLVFQVMKMIEMRKFFSINVNAISIILFIYLINMADIIYP